MSVYLIFEFILVPSLVPQALLLLQVLRLPPNPTKRLRSPRSALDGLMVTAAITAKTPTSTCSPCVFSFPPIYL
jgi:hypothetical protein